MDKTNIKQIIDNLTQVTDLLYQENTQPAYACLVAILPQLEEVIMQLDQETQQDMIEKLQSALGAMEEGDNTLLADVLQYEIIEQLKMSIEE